MEEGGTSYLGSETSWRREGPLTLGVRPHGGGRDLLPWERDPLPWE